MKDVKLPPLIVDNAIAWGGIVADLVVADKILSTIAILLTVVSSLLGIYTSIKKLKDK